MSTIRRNSSAVCRRERAVIMMFMPWPGAVGWAPTWPDGTETLRFSTALRTSEGISLNALSLSGSSQIRMAYWPPNTLTWPTPLIREIGSSRRAFRKSEMSTSEYRPLVS